MAEGTPISGRLRMKDLIVSEIKRRIASTLIQRVAVIAEDPEGFFTPHEFKITVYAFLGRKGEWVISKGGDKISPALARQVINLCEANGLTDGWIADKSDNGKSWPCIGSVLRFRPTVSSFYKTGLRPFPERAVTF